MSGGWLGSLHEQGQLVDLGLRGLGMSPARVGGQERLPPFERPEPFRDQKVKVLVNTSRVGRVDDNCGRFRFRAREVVADENVDLINPRELGHLLEAHCPVDIQSDRHARRQNDTVFDKRTHPQSPHSPGGYFAKGPPAR
ncbi:hypothetical protein [Roseiarcus sp.]|uniref:hypothetical protein n=1 Tax=Roseiarcus sp. TaxID=1969460 RepID=UPI003F962DE2